nr:GNAT family N-acetyltransferase [Actinopolymorpha pittospori]
MRRDSWHGRNERRRSVNVQGRVRQATEADVPAILDLLTHFERPREFLRPRYEEDPTYRPRQSFVWEEDGRMLAHVRVYEQTLRLPATTVTVAGIGNVVTHREHRRRGYNRRVLDAALADAAHRGFAYSLLWTNSPFVYERHGYGAAPEQVVTGVAAAPDGSLPANARPVVVRPFEITDLPAVARLYEQVHGQRPGTVVRDQPYWRANLAFRREEPGDFLLALDGDALVGYVRTRRDGTALEVTELTSASTAAARHLLTVAAAPVGGRVTGRLPESAIGLLDAAPHVEESWRLMGRPLRIDNLAAALRDSRPDTHPDLSVHPAGGRDVLLRTPTTAPTAPIGPGLLTALLLWGAADRLEPHLATRPDAPLLRSLFPRQDGVLWQADSF